MLELYLVISVELLNIFSIGGGWLEFDFGVLIEFIINININFLGFLERRFLLNFLWILEKNDFIIKNFFLNKKVVFFLKFSYFNFFVFLVSIDICFI